MLHEGIVEINSAKDLERKMIGLHFLKMGVDVCDEDTTSQLVFWIDEIMHYIVPVQSTHGGMYIEWKREKGGWGEKAANKFSS